MTAANISVSPEVKAVLPDVLIDWLCELAASEYDLRTPVQAFSLTLEKLGDRCVQDIQYAGSLRRIFGFSPVICNLQIRHFDNEHQLVMAN